MATKIRLQRHGRKRRPFFHIVVADSKSPRDGRYIERLGIYNPNTNPATIELDHDRALHWYGTGAQPTDTAKAILSYKGVLYHHHLLGGGKNGAFSAEEAEAKFTNWVEGKTSKIDSKINKLAQAKAKTEQENFDREQKLKEAIAAKVIAKNSPLAEEVAETSDAVESTNEVAETANEVVEQTIEDNITETPVETIAETTEEVVAEVTEAAQNDVPETSADAETTEDTQA